MPDDILSEIYNNTEDDVVKIIIDCFDNLNKSPEELEKSLVEARILNFDNKNDKEILKNK